MIEILVQVNALGYYKKQKREIDANINLDGLTPHSEFTVKFDSSAFHRILRTIAIPSVRNLQGVFIIDLVGSGFVAVWLGMNLLTFRNINAPQFIGFQNYLDVLSDPRFFKALQFTLLIMAITVPAQTLIGFIVALLLDQVAVRN